MVKEQKLRFFKRSPEISFLTLNPFKKTKIKKHLEPNVPSFTLKAGFIKFKMYIRRTSRSLRDLLVLYQVKADKLSTFQRNEA